MRRLAPVVPWLLAVLYGLVLLALAARAPLRTIGDGGEYLAYALAMSHGDSPALTTDSITRVRAAIAPFDPDHAAWPMEQAGRRSPDGRLHFAHFWLYPALAAPFVAIARGLDADPRHGFVALNILLLAAAAGVVCARLGPWLAVFLFAGPIIWWSDKVHPEAFIVSLMAIALTVWRERPGLAMVCAGLVGAQVPPFALLRDCGDRRAVGRDLAVSVRAGAGRVRASSHVAGTPGVAPGPLPQSPTAGGLRAEPRPARNGCANRGARLPQDPSSRAGREPGHVAAALPARRRARRREPGVLCYANRAGRTYRFRRLSQPLDWLKYDPSSVWSRQAETGLRIAMAHEDWWSLRPLSRRTAHGAVSALSDVEVDEVFGAESRSLWILSSVGSAARIDLREEGATVHAVLVDGETGRSVPAALTDAAASGTRVLSLPPTRGTLVLLLSADRR